MSDKRFIRTHMLLGDNAVEKLERSCVAVFGIGGVGSYTVEALARCGIGKLILVDADTVSLSNINRQLIATEKTVGINKVDVAKSRILDINPTAVVETYPVFFSEENKTDFLLDECDYVVDAIDSVTSKLALIKLAKEKSIPIISCMGTGNKLDPTKFEITDISKTSFCPLARVMRKQLKSLGIGHLKVLYSPEEPIVPLDCGEPLPEGRRAIPGSVAFVTGTAGLIIAGEVIKDLCKTAADG